MQQSNHDKHHFFIGNIFNNDDQVRLLRNIQNKLKKKYRLKNFHYNNNFYSNLIYLGYMNNETATMYMDNIMSHLLNALSQRFEPLTCNYTGYKLESDKSLYKISLKFTDENNYLEKIIIPYLHYNGIVPIYERRSDKIYKPQIDLIYYKKSFILEGKKSNAIRIEVPKVPFEINHISLIKGTTTRVRSGMPSIHDQMSLVEVSKYEYPLQGKKNNRINNSQLNNSRSNNSQSNNSQSNNFQF